MANLTTIQARQEAIVEGLKNPFIKELMNDLTEEEKKEFKSNLLELGASNKFLLEKVEPKRIVKLALDLTKDGFNINPYFKEVSIVPFKLKDSADYAPSPIIHLKGWQEKLYLGQFFLKVDRVWNINGNEKRESQMKLSELAEIDDTNKAFRDKYFLGFMIVAEDLTGELPKQEVFVSYKYTKEATKNAQAPKEFELQALVHKATRRALNEMVIPRARLTLRDYDTIATDLMEDEPTKAISSSTTPKKAINKALEMAGVQPEEPVMPPQTQKVEVEKKEIEAEIVEELDPIEVDTKFRQAYAQLQDPKSKSALIKDRKEILEGVAIGDATQEQLRKVLDLVE